MAQGTWIAELIGAALLVVLVLLVLAIYLRRRYIARGAALILCAERAVGSTTWRPRLARYDRASLDLFSLGGIGVHPLRSVERGMSGLVSVASLPREEWPALMDDPVVLRCRAMGETFDLAVPRAHYTALRSWLESSPPGVPHQAA